jgi:hypothetical protein
LCWARTQSNQLSGDTMKKLLILSLLLFAALQISACSDDTADIQTHTVYDAEYFKAELERLAYNLGNEDIQQLSDEEIAGLVYMREEEKLARDVYITFNALYSANIFSNISASEQAHTDAVLLLINRYNIDDPSADMPIGAFQNEGLQALYDDLVAQGNQDLESAFLVACAIEEIDILDLIEYMDNTEYKDLELVYQHLLDGSENHLRSYVNQWENQSGVEYEPRYLSVEQYEAIISAGGNGGGGHGGGGQGGGGQGGNGRGGRK